MNHVYLELELLSPVAVSARSATVGGHETLSYIPGAQLVGAAARALGLRPGAPPPPDAWDLLGAVRFGDALPLVGDHVGYAAPFALHGPKGDAQSASYNLARSARPEGVQLQQVREQRAAPDGTRVTVRSEETLRTAIEDEGRAREGFLFGIDALSAGQRFVARLDADDPAALERVAGLLEGAELALGRSRGAEFGRALARRRAAVGAVPASAPVPHVAIWLLSDLALRDPQTGAPRVQLAPADLGLGDEWQVAWDRSFVRTRRYSPFNGARRRPDLERQVVQAGSVYVLARADGAALPADAHAALRSRLELGIGDHVQEGLGRAALDPTLLAEPRVTLRPAAAPAPAPAAPVPGGLLGGWVRQRQQAREALHADEERARELREQMRSARIRPAQWGEVRRFARDARILGHSGAQLVATLEEHLSDGARLHGWPRSARERFLVSIAGMTPGAIERACTLLVKEESP